MKKFFKIILMVLLATILIALGYIFITFPPVLAGMAAKTMCSCIFVMGRDQQSVMDKEFQVFPGMSSASIEITSDSTVTATVFWKSSKAIFRKGLGCILLAEQSEEDSTCSACNPSATAGSSGYYCLAIGGGLRFCSRQHKARSN